MTAGSTEPPRRRLLLDIQATQSRNFPERGIARYVAELARALLRVPGLVGGLLINPVLPFPGHLHPELSCSPLLRWNTATELRRLSDGGGRFAYHLMSPTELGPPVDSVLPAHVLEAGLPMVLTLYDLVPLLEPETYLDGPQKRERYLVRMELYRSAELVLALSESARDDAVRLLGLDPARIAVVGGGAGRFFRPSPPGDDPLARLREAVPGLTREFVLSVTGTDARKNTERLIEAYARLHAGLRRWVQLVVACRVDEAAAARWRALAAGCGLGPDELVLTGQVTDAALRDLYRSARVMVFPSLYEGFGLPVAEAIACDCPVITSSTSAAPEVLDDPRSTFDPRDVEAMSEAMRDALESPRHLGALRDLARRRAPWWTWDAVAAREVTALRLLDASAPRPAPPAAPRMRVALVGALPPSPSAAAPVLGAVAAALGRRCHVDLYAGDRGDAGDLPPGSARLPVEILMRTGAAATYDAVIYAVEGLAAEQPVLAAARRHPGILWLTGTGAADLYRADALTPPPLPPAGAAWRKDPPPLPPPPARLAAAIRAQYADRAPGPVVDELDHGGTMTAQMVDRFGILLLGELVRGARAVVVGDEAALRRVDLDLGPSGSPRPVHALPTAAGADAVAAALLAIVSALRVADPDATDAGERAALRAS